MGRLVKSKGCEDLIVSFSQLKTEHHLVILGQGPDLEKLRKLALNKGVAEKVHFYGFLKNPYPVILKAEVYVLPSYLEGFPNALVEAMALSRPVLSTNCKDGPIDILVHNGNINKGEAVEAEYGIMVNTGDTTGIYKGLEKLLASLKVKEHYSKKSLERAKEFSQENFYIEFKNIISTNILG
jgi:N-acetylgalactosamine-N,N'-diacetylbacillosaminyl-diphospho-undecaprenol 4-alpha-N-acetylgalactosaminyltransferase